MDPELQEMLRQACDFCADAMEAGLRDTTIAARLRARGLSVGGAAIIIKALHHAREVRRKKQRFVEARQRVSDCNEG